MVAQMNGYPIIPTNIAGILVGVPRTASIVPLFIVDVIVLGSDVTAREMKEKVSIPTSRNPKY